MLNAVKSYSKYLISTFPQGGGRGCILKICGYKILLASCNGLLSNKDKVQKFGIVQFIDSFKLFPRSF